MQGITGAEGSFHAEQCLAYNNVVGGVTPGKGGQTALEVKVYLIPVQKRVSKSVRMFR